MKMLDLPVFDIPELPDKRIPPDKRHAWHLRNIKYLSETGQLERLRKHATRVPVSERFVLK